MKKIIVLLVFWIFTLSSAWATQFTTQPATLPTYQFRSTSTCQSTVGNSTFTTTTEYAPYSATPNCGPRRTKLDDSGSWDEGDSWDDPNEDDYPTGVKPNPDPIGEPMVLLLLALGYLLVKVERGKRKVERSSKVES